MQRETLLSRTCVELADTSVDHFDVVELLTCSPTDAWRYLASRQRPCCWSPRRGLRG